MSTYPGAIDTDATIIRVDEDITNLGGISIDQLRDAVFKIENELGIGLSGSVGTLASRLAVALNANGTINSTALSSVGLLTFPLDDAQVGAGAGIQESKLALAYTTTDLHTLIVANAELLSSLTAFVNLEAADFNKHLAGATFLSDNVTSARHTSAQIDLTTPLVDADGNTRTATTVDEALSQINNDLTSHEDSTAGAHQASAITVNTSQFIEIPQTANTVKKVIDYLDNAETLNLGQHRAQAHANGIALTARSDDFNDDGYGLVVVKSTSATTYLVNSPSVNPVDDLSTGDDIIKFTPLNTNFAFDAQFSQVKVGDVAEVDYNNGVATTFIIDSIRYTAGSEWVIRINGTNLFETTSAKVKITTPEADSQTQGILAVAAANATPSASFSSMMASVIVGHPRAASVAGLEFDPCQLDSNHYSLYLELYPTGNPADHVITLPGIDVTQDQGASSGFYTLSYIVQQANNGFRKIGNNFRFIAFEYNGRFGISLADAINDASFAIITGTNSDGVISTGSFTNNVIGGNSVDDFDALGFGPNKANVASPTYKNTWLDDQDAQIPTNVIAPRTPRYYTVNGIKKDILAPGYLTNSDGYWDGYISNRNPVGSFTVETTYIVQLNLEPSGLKPGKTVTVQPTVSFTDPLYSDIDYGRFIIKTVDFITNCDGYGVSYTQITVINGRANIGGGFGTSAKPQLPVLIYFSDDSVSFNNEEVIDTTPTTTDYHRLHEIYIDDTGHTFAHERARMPRQSEDATAGFLGTDRWHIHNISPKLRGFNTKTALNFHKYLRFYLESYDSTSGIYTGFVGQRTSGPSSPGIINSGPLVTGRKNVISRFYDNTGIDWVELIFFDTSASPGSNVMSTNAARWVDIEIFPSLQNDPEIMCIATCEVNWSPAAGQDIIQFVNDVRQFGSISENELTNSAIDFISAADSWLHENGVIQGFDFQNLNTSNNQELYFNGGLAFINGKVITIDASTVTLPSIYKYGNSKPTTVKWCICASDSGELTSIVITTAPIQYFGTIDGSDSYYLPSVTFDELIQTRKDLCPLYIVIAHIASFTITPASDILDIRRYVQQGNADQTLTLTPNFSSGNFHSFSSLQNWINYYSVYNNLGSKVVVKVKGRFDVNSSIDLSGFSTSNSNGVVFEGDGATFNVNVGSGILLGSGVTLKNISFIYTPPNSISYTSGDLINTGNGCIYLAPGNNKNINIEYCDFSQGASYSQRPPFINFEISNNQTLFSTYIYKNKFDSSLSPTQAAIAICGTNGGSSTNSAFLKNVFIEENSCSDESGIYVTATNNRPGIYVSNCSIKDNGCGVIGYLVTTAANASDYSNKLNISGNRCRYIYSSRRDGQNVGITSQTNPFNFGTGFVTIFNNSCHWIHVISQGNFANEEYSFIKILNNDITGFDPTYLNKFVPGNTGSAYNAGIILFTNYIESNAAWTALISGNKITAGFYDGAGYGYTTYGIWCMSSATITDNIISGLSSGINVSGIFLDKGFGGTVSGARAHTVTGNQLYRGTSTIGSYIFINPTTSSDYGVISNNTLDSPTIDGTNTATITYFSSHPGYTIEKNKNQQVTQIFSIHDGDFQLFGILSGGNDPNSSRADTVTDANGVAGWVTNQAVAFNNFGFADSLKWTIPLAGKIPWGASLVSLTVFSSYFVTIGDDGDVITKNLYINLNSVYAATNPDLSNEFTLTTTRTAYSLSISDVQNTPGIFYQNPISSPIDITSLGLTLSSSVALQAQIQVDLVINDSKLATVLLDSFAITYTW